MLQGNRSNEVTEITRYQKLQGYRSNEVTEITRLQNLMMYASCLCWIGMFCAVFHNMNRTESFCEGLHDELPRSSAVRMSK